MKRVKILLILLIACTLSLAVHPAFGAEKAPATAVPVEKAEKAAPEAAVTPPVEKAVPTKPASEKKATIAINPLEKNTFGVDLENSIPVRGIQFTVNGMKMTEVRTASRTEGFMAKFNEDTGIVIVVSTAAEEIPPGKGPVLKILGEKLPDAEVSLSKIMLVDRDRKLIE